MLFAFAWLLVAQTLTKPPELVAGAPPSHPIEAQNQGATVSLTIVIDPLGCVSRVEVSAIHVDGDGPAAPFAWAALGAATNLLFVPAEVDGKPAAVTISQTLTFVPDVAKPVPTASSPNHRRGTLSGRVRAQGSVLPLPAELRVSSNLESEHPASELVFDADDDGRFALELAEGPWHLEVSCSGHEPSDVDVYVGGGSVEVVDFALRPRRANAFETVVRGARSAPGVSRVSLSRAEVTGIPGTYGDALRVVESLPGVARAPLLGGALLVRGGLPADTQVLIEGVPVPTLYHFGGLRSVLNGAFVEELTVMPGGFPARYGNATAGVIDVATHALRADPLEASFTLDLLDVGFFFGGTARLSQLASTLPDVRIGAAARRSHTEVPANLLLGTATLLRRALPPIPVPSWYDWQFKLESEVVDDVTLSLFAFGAEDQFSFLGAVPDLGLGDAIDVGDLLNSLLGSQFTRVVGRAVWRPLPGVSHTLQPYGGTTRRGLLADGVVVPLLAGDVLSPPQDQSDWGVRDESRVRLWPWLELRSGLDAQQSTTQVQRLSMANLEDLSEATKLSHAAISATALWSDLVVVLGALTVIPGVRGELSSIQVNDEDPIFDGKTSTVADAAFVDPRVQLRYRFGPLLTLKGAFGGFHQRPRLQAVGFDVDGDALLHPQALHLVFGLESELGPELGLDAQVYGVRRLALTRDRNARYRAGVVFAGFPGLGSFDSLGSGETEGFELLLRQRPRTLRSGSFFGWVAYTFSRTVTSLGNSREPVVPAPFDQTHNLVIVAKLTLPWDLTAGARFAFVTGNPGPMPDSIATEHDVSTNSYTPLLSTLRPARLPPFHRLDLRLEQTWIFDWYRVTPFLEVLNTYNWLNPEVFFPSGDYRQRERRVLLPGPPLMPVVGLEMTL